MSRIESSFDITRWDETVLSELADAPKISRVDIAKTYRGALEASSEGELLTAMDGEGNATYVCMERVIGILDGRAGSFVLHHGASSDATTGAAGRVLPGSATGDLRGSAARWSSATTSMARPASCSTTASDRRDGTCGLRGPGRRLAAHLGALARCQLEVA